MDKILSIRKNNQVFSLFVKIQEYQKSANRTDIVNAAIQKALDDRDNGTLNWNTIASGKIPSVYIENDDFPEFIQLRVDEDKYGEIVNQMKKDFNLEKGSPAPFVVKLLLINLPYHKIDFHQHLFFLLYPVLQKYTTEYFLTPKESQ